MRNWNGHSSQKSISLSSFWAYLWGIETSTVQTGRRKFCIVLSLPMRNWNMEKPKKCTFKFVCFEPTYEELKQTKYRGINVHLFSFWAYLWGIETLDGKKMATISEEVLSLPMRNWNTNLLKVSFLQYTVGFEPTYEELKHINDKYIMRLEDEFWAYLWGIETETRLQLLVLFLSVLSLPMRNWNTLLRNCFFYIFSPSFEPTYEELKPF